MAGGDTSRAGRLVVLSYQWLGICQAALGAVHEGLTFIERAVALGDATGSPEIMAGVRTGVGLIDVLRLDVPRAIEALSRARALCEGLDTPLLRQFISGYLGHAYALAGRLDDAIELMESSSRRIEALGVIAMHSLRLVSLADAYRRAGRLDEAEALAARALALAREREECGHESMALALQGAVAIHREPPDVARAEGALFAALEIAEKGAMRPTAARWHLELGVVYGRAGKIGQAREHLRVAEEQFRALGLPRWLELVDAQVTALARMRGCGGSGTGPPAQ